MSSSTIRGLTSIIVPCWNQLEFTQQCLAALKTHTGPSWELIVIDNGSTDGTGLYLAGARDLAAVAVTVISNTTNLEFPAAINQGLQLARAEYLVLLNNDVVVTDGWLDQIIALANSKSGREGDVTAENAGNAETQIEEERERRPAVDSGAGSGDLLRDMTFDREIPTPGLIALRHRYSMGMVGLMEMLLGDFIMPRPIPVPIRQAMFRLWQKGRSARQIAESLGLPCSTVRRLLQRFRLHGTDGLSPDYWHPSVPQAVPSEPLQTAMSLRREHPTWGAGLIRVQLLLETPERPLPSERTFQRWFVRAGLSPAPAGRPPRSHLDRATAPHETWQMDAKEHIRIKTREEVSWLRLIDECSGAVLWTAVFPPRGLAEGPP
jgi:transposase